MTIICALRQDSETWIGSDTLSTNGSFSFRSIHKWITGHGRAVGFAGDQRVEELAIPAQDDLFETAKTPLEVGKYLRKLCLDDGFEPTRDEKGDGWAHFGQADIYVDAAGIFALDTSFTPALVDEPFWARGSGCDIAMGAYYVLAGKNPQEIMQTVIAAAMEHDDHCGGDAWIERLI